VNDYGAWLARSRIPKLFIAGDPGEIVDVCDNLFQSARNSLILKRRGVRVVEGARLEIALAVCDGVLQISITVAKPTT